MALVMAGVFLIFVGTSSGVLLRWIRSTVVGDVSYAVTFEASSFLHVSFSLFYSEAVDVHGIRVSSWSNVMGCGVGLSRCGCGGSLLSVVDLLESSILGIESRGLDIPLGDGGGNFV